MQWWGSGGNVDWQRELRDAALVSQLVRDSANRKRLNSISSIIQLLVGESDNLTVTGMLALFESERIETARQLTDDSDPSLETFAEAIRESGLARQRIRSQSIVSNPYDSYKVPPPSLFQMFGQVFTLDSLLLSHSVFDSIIFEEEKQRRMMPTSLDVAAALGNDHAVRLLEPELRKWNYSANLLAGRDFVDQLEPGFWNDNIYHRWLDALRTLDDQPASANLPEVMRRPVWHAKQLQTQLASWSELRHDNVLYAKQSYTSVFGCQYPDGFVEPYPKLYRKLGELATATATRLGGLKIQSDQPGMQQQQQRMQDRQISFLHRFAEIMDQLEVIALRELEAQPMTNEQRRFIETTIDRRGSLPNGSGSKPHYDGWYCQLLYNEDKPSSWNPTIVDVHTDPSGHEALHVGVGDVNFAVIAVDNQNDVAAYVGPVYSYYEFIRPAEQRLNDQQWQQLISLDKLPPRPGWTNSFTSSPAQRSYTIENFRRRPDVEVLMPRPFGVETVAVCRQIDGLRRFKADASGKLQPGKPLLLYVEPANLTWARRRFSLSVKLEVKTTLIDASGAAVAKHVSDPLELHNGRPGELVYTTLELAIPKSLKRGAYKLQVELKDALTDPARTATAELTMEY